MPRPLHQSICRGAPRKALDSSGKNEIHPATFVLAGSHRSDGGGNSAVGASERLIRPKKPGNASGGKEPQFRSNEQRSDRTEIGMSLQPPKRVGNRYGLTHTPPRHLSTPAPKGLEINNFYNWRVLKCCGMIEWCSSIRRENGWAVILLEPSHHQPLSCFSRMGWCPASLEHSGQRGWSRRQ